MIIEKKRVETNERRGNILFTGRLRVIHYEGNLSLRKLIRKKYIYGKYLHKYLNKSKSRIYPSSTFMIIRLTPYRLLHYFKSNKMMLREPTLILGLLFMKMFEFTAMLLGSITSKVKGE